MIFRDAEPESDLAVTGATEESGTEITFLPSPETFSNRLFDLATLEHRLRELAFLNSGVRIVLTDNREPEPIVHELHYEGGLAAFVAYLEPQQSLHTIPIFIAGERDGLTVEVAMEWTDSYHETMLLLHQQHPATRRRHPSGRVSRRLDAAGQCLCPGKRHRQEGKGVLDRG